MSTRTRKLVKLANETKALDNSEEEIVSEKSTDFIDFSRDD